MTNDKVGELVKAVRRLLSKGGDVYDMELAPDDLDFGEALDAVCDALTPFERCYPEDEEDDNDC